MPARWPPAGSVDLSSCWNKPYPFSRLLVAGRHGHFGSTKRRRDGWRQAISETTMLNVSSPAAIAVLAEQSPT
jgi:hypothetical protein